MSWRRGAVEAGVKPLRGRPGAAAVAEGGAVVDAYLCYVHVPGAMTPLVRLVNVERGHTVRGALMALIDEWPEFELIEVYDDDNAIAVRVTLTNPGFHGH